MTTMTAQQLEPAAKAVLEVLPHLADADRAEARAELDDGAREVMAAAVRTFATQITTAAAACGDLMAKPAGAAVFAGKPEARSWYRRYLPVIPAMVAAATELGLDELAWQIAADAEQGYFTNMKLAAWQQPLALGAAAAERTGDPAAVGRVLLASGGMHRFSGRTALAIADYTRAEEMFQTAGDRHGRIFALNRLATTCFDTRDLDRALELFAEVAALATGMDEQLAALAVANMAEAHHDRGDHLQAVSFARRALEMFQTCGAAPHRITQGHLYLTRALIGSQDLDEAAPHVRQLLEDLGGGDDYATTALATHLTVGEWHLASGRFDLAQAAFEAAVSMRLGGYHQADTLEGLGRALAGQGHFGDAVVLHELALGTRQQTGVPFYTARALTFLAEALAGAGGHAASGEAAGQALELLAEVSDPAAEELRGRLAGLSQ